MARAVIDSAVDLVQDRLPAIVTVSVVAVASDAAFTFSRLWMRRRHLLHRIQSGAHVPMMVGAAGCPAKAAAGAALASNGLSMGHRDSSSGGAGDAETPKFTNGSTTGSPPMMVRMGSSSETLQSTSSSVSLTNLDRAEERRHIYALLQERGIYTAFIGDADRGVSSLMRGVSYENLGVSYVSFSGVETLEDAARTVREEFSLTAAVRSPLGYIAQRLILVVAQGDSGGAPEDPDEQDDSGDGAAAWRSVTRLFAEALEALASSACKARATGVVQPLPVLILDHVSSMETTALHAIQAWASQLAGRGLMHVAFVTETPTFLFSSPSASNLRVAHVPDPTAGAVAALMMTRCPGMSHALAGRLIVDICGTTIGIAHRVSLLYREIERHPHTMRSRQLQSLPPFLVGGGAGPALGSDTGNDGDVTPPPFTPLVPTMERINSRGGHDISPAWRGYEAGEVFVGERDDEQVYAFILRTMITQAFATTRPLHLYSCQPMGDVDLDETRLTIFFNSLLLLEKEEDGNSRCPHRQCAMMRRQTTTGSAFDAATADDKATRENLMEDLGVADGSVSQMAMERITTTMTECQAREFEFTLALQPAVSFSEMLSVVPLRVFSKKMEEHRTRLPCVGSFDVLRFKSPLTRRQMLWTLGDRGTERRAAAMTALAATLERCKSECGYEDWEYVQASELIERSK